MASNIAARAATAAELIKFRSSRTAVFSAQINQASFTYPITELDYDTETGDYLDIKAGYLCYVGTAAGLSDKGIARIYKAATSSKVYLVPVASGRIDFADDDHLTIWSFGRQGSKLHLAIQHPATIYTAQIDGTPATLDGVTELTYDAGTGTLADVLQGMTVYIGSSAGLRDIGVCRVRKAPTSDTLYINQVSGIQFADNQYITIVESMGLWARDIFTVGNVPYMDYDIAFGDVRNGGCIPRVAPMVAVLKIDAVTGTVTYTAPDPSNTACYDGATVTSYLYNFPGSASSGNLTSGTGTAYAVYDTAGEYRWSCTIEDSLGRQTVTHRWIFVNPADIPCTVGTIAGNYDEGGWSFPVTCYDDVATSEITERALCVLWADDWYNGVEGSIGKVTGYENIVAVGWIDGESITYDSENGSVTFSVRGASHWLSKLKASPIELVDTSTAPASWKELYLMTIDKALAHLLFWTSTAPYIMDCYLTGDTNRANVFANPSGALLDQLKDIAGRIFADVQTNSLGQMYIEIETQMTDSVTRAALPVVMDITPADMSDETDLERSTSEKSSMLELSANESYNGSALSNVFSRAPGNYGAAFGSIDSFDDYIVTDQDECNRVAGCLYAVANNEYDPLDIALPANIRLFDITPRMFATITIDAATNPRNIGLTAARLIPRSINYDYDAEVGSLETSATFEIEAVGVDGVSYYPPPVVDEGLPNYELDDFGVDFPNGDLGDFFPSSIPSLGTAPAVTCSNLAFNTYRSSWSKSEIRGDDVDRIARIYFPCRIHAYDPTNKLSTVTGWHFYGDAANSKFHIYAIKGGARVLTADGSGVFSPPTQVDVDGFECELDSGLGTVVTYEPLDVVGSGTVDAINDAGIAVPVVDGKLYSIEGTNGPWYYQNTPPENAFPFYNFDRNAIYHNPLQGIGASGAPLVMHLDVPASCLFTEAVNGFYARTYFYGDATEVFQFIVSDFLFTDNTGSLDYILRNARANGRRVTLSSATIKNVCPPSA